MCKRETVGDKEIEIERERDLLSIAHNSIEALDHEIETINQIKC